MTPVPRDHPQRERIEALLAALATNPFYRAKLGVSVTIDDWPSLPFTTKAELSADQAAHPPFGTNLTYPLERYTRLHQTSGTTGAPLRILDTPESWRWWQDCWAEIYRAAGVAAADRVYFCFSFGPFIGFWAAFDGADHIGALRIAGGAQSTLERVLGVVATGATVLVCTPTYALRLAEVARENGIDLARSALRVSVHAGEPGASIPATRDRIESALGVRSFDHAGATEVGAYSYSCDARDGLHVIEREFLVEVRDPTSGAVSDLGEGELVLTNLGRLGSPVIRYRTGDHVVAVRERCSCGRSGLKLRGGIIGRVDDMVIVRGVNVYPSALESIIRGFAEIEEFRVEVSSERGMSAIRLVVELRPGAADVTGALSLAIHNAIGIRCPVVSVAPGVLPRFEMKARRVVRVE